MTVVFVKNGGYLLVDPRNAPECGNPITPFLASRQGRALRLPRKSNLVVFGRLSAVLIKVGLYVSSVFSRPTTWEQFGIVREKTILRASDGLPDREIPWNSEGPKLNNSARDSMRRHGIFLRRGVQERIWAGYVKS